MEWRERRFLEGNASEILQKHLKADPIQDFEAANQKLTGLGLTLIETSLTKSEQEDAVTAILQNFLGCYECSNAEEILDLIEGTDDLPPFNNLSINEKRKKQLKLSELTRTALNEIDPAWNPNSETTTFSPLLNFISEHQERNLIIEIFDWKTWSFLPTIISSSTPFETRENLVLLKHEEGSLCLVASRKQLHGSQEEYWDDIFEQIVQSQELLPHLISTFKSIPAPELKSNVASNLEEIRKCSTLEQFASICSEPETCQLSLLSSLVKEETYISSSQNYSRNNLLLEIKTHYIECSKAALSTIYMEKAAGQNEQIELTKAKKQQLASNISNIQREIEEAEAKIDLAKAQKSNLEEELESTEASDLELVQKLKDLKSKAAFLNFQSKLWKAELGYELVLRGKPMGAERMDFATLCGCIKACYEIPGFDDKLHIDRVNDNSENKEALIDILNSLHTPESYNSKKSGGGLELMEVSGRNIILSQVLAKLNNDNSWSEIRIMATHNLFLDVDLAKEKFGGKNVALVADKMRVMDNRVIDVGGKDGAPEKKPVAADNGKYEGRDGYDGIDASAGESAGNILLRARFFGNSGSLKLLSKGGNGGHGQSGGDGQKGADGNDGKDGELPSGWWDSIKNYFNSYKIVRGTQGKAGGKGGNGGRAGLGGEGGTKGDIVIMSPQDVSWIVTDSRDGERGADGENGIGASGGTGGRHGADDGMAHQGSWCPGFSGCTYGKGKLDKTRYERWYGFAGYELVFLQSEAEVHSSRAARGQDGISGQSAQNRAHQRQSCSRKNKIADTDVLNEFDQLVAASGDSRENDRSFELAAIHKETTAVTSAKTSNEGSKAELRKKLQSVEAEGKEIEGKRDKAKEVESERLDEMEKVNEQLARQEAVLSNIKLEELEMMEIVNEAESAMKTESLQRMEQSSRQSTVLRQADEEALGTFAEKAKIPIGEEGPYNSSPPKSDSNNFPILTQQILKQIDSNNAVVNLLKKLSEAGTGRLMGQAKKANFWSKNSKKSIDYLNAFDGCTNIVKPDDLQKANEIIKEIEAYPFIHPALLEVVSKIFTKHCRNWLIKEVQKTHQGQDSTVLLKAVENIAKIMKAVPTNGVKIPRGFLGAALTMVEIFKDKEVREKGMEVITHQVILKLAGLWDKDTNNVVEIMKQTLQSSTIEVASEKVQTFRQILPYIELSIENLDGLQLLVLKSQTDLQLYISEHQNYYQQLRMLSHSLFSYFEQKFKDAINIKLEKMLDSVKNETDDTGKLVSRLESPYNLMTFQKKLEVYQEFFQTADIGEFYKKTFPETTAAKDFPKKLTEIQKFNRGETIYKRLLNFSDQLKYLETEEQEMKTVFESLESAIEYFQTNGKQTQSLLVLDGIYQFQGAILQKLSGATRNKLSNLAQSPMAELKLIVKETENLSESIYKILDNAQLEIKMEEIVIGYHCEMLKLCLGHVFISQFKDKKKCKMANGNSATGTILEIKKQILELEAECHTANALIEKLDEIFEELKENLFQKMGKINQNLLTEYFPEFLTNLVKEDKLTLENLHLINLTLAIGHKFSAVKSIDPDQEEKEIGQEKIFSKLEKYIQSKFPNQIKSGEIQQLLQLASVATNPIYHNSSTHVQILEAMLENQFLTKQFVLEEYASTFDDKVQNFINIWRKMDGDLPIFAGPLVEFFTTVCSKVDELMEHGNIPNFDSHILYKNQLVRYFTRKFFPANIMDLGIKVNEDFSKLLDTLKGFQIEITSAGNKIPRWGPNFIYILNEFCSDFTETKNVSSYQMEAFSKSCQILQDLKKKYELLCFIELQQNITNMMRKLCVSNQKMPNMLKLEQAEISLWVAHYPEHLPEYCNWYFKAFSGIEGLNPIKQTTTQREKFANSLWNSNISDYEATLIKRAMNWGQGRLLLNFTEQPFNGNRFLELFDKNFGNKDWAMDYPLFTAVEKDVAQRLSEAGIVNDEVKAIMLQQNCNDWQECFTTKLISIQFSQIVSLFTTQINSALLPEIESHVELQELLRKFCSHYDISPSTEENLINATTTNLPKLIIDIRSLIKFKLQFNRTLTICKDRLAFSDWLSAIYKQFQNNSKVSLKTLTQLLFRVAEENHDQIQKLTLAQKPEDWIGELYLQMLRGHYIKFCSKLSLELVPWPHEKFLEEMRSNLPSGLNNHTEFLLLMIDALQQEWKTSDGAIVVNYPQVIATMLKEFKGKFSQELFEKFSKVSIGRWSFILQETKLLQHYPQHVVATILRFEAKFGSDAMNKLAALKNLINVQNLDLILRKFCSEEWKFDPELLSIISTKCKKYTEKKMSEQEAFAKLCNICSEHTKKKERTFRDTAELVSIMANEKKNEGLIERYLSSQGDSLPLLQKMVDDVKTAYNSRSALWPENEQPIRVWGKMDIYKWSCQLLVSKHRMTLKNRFSSAVRKLKKNILQTFLSYKKYESYKGIKKPDMVKEINDNLPEVLAVCNRAMELVKGFPLRDTQLIAINLLLDHSRWDNSCLAEVATGEGKTLILAVVVATKALQGEDVDLVTSSSVLAIQALSDVRPFYSLLGISAAVNCDPAAEAENVRRGRYQNKVIYGDLGSFQRDVLLTEFFEKRMTMGRSAGVVVVDEVDSMLLDKGDNILYLSHNIPELNLLCPILIDIWAAVHAKDVGSGTSDDILKIAKYIKRRVDNQELTYPNYLKDFVSGRLNIWIKNAFLAKNIEEKDSYVVSNIDQKGHRVVLIDKDTGVEQTSMHYNGGLHQFMQLKHGEALAPESLKAVFMSNITYLQRFPGQLMGITGTLGSEMERSLLAECYKVSFFQIPRFAPRRCVEEEAILVQGEQKWLESITAQVVETIKSGRAILIIAENVKMVELIANGLKKSPFIQPETVYSYTSAFDSDFAAKAALGAGEIIVATNIAGRGTDIRTSEQLNHAGGLKVILSFLAPNVRIEEQAFGRTSRAGNRGSVQYIVNLSESQSNQTTTIESLKFSRDDAESIRLNRFKQKSIPRIEMEEKLFQKFTILLKELTTKLKSKESKIPEKFIDVHLDNLKNRWALWLDSMESRISASTGLEDKERRTGIIFAEFEKFANKMRATLLASMGKEGSPIFERGPFEVTKLGRLYESLEKFPIAKKYFERVINDEPFYSEIARYYLASCLLREKPGDWSQKKLAAFHLKLSRKTLNSKIMTMGASVQILKMITNRSRNEGKGFITSGYETQIKNECEILQVHIGKIDEAIGVNVLDVYAIKGIQGVLDDEEAKSILETLTKRHEIMKRFRISRKVRIDLSNNEIKIQNSPKEIGWPSVMTYCKSSILTIIQTCGQTSSRELTKSQLIPFIMTKEKFWLYLLQEGLIKDKPKESKTIVNFKPEMVKIFESIEFKDYASAKGIIQRILNENNGKEYNQEIFEEVITNPNCINWLDAKLKELKIVDDIDISSASVCTENLSIKKGKLIFPESIDKDLHPLISATLLEMNQLTYEIEFVENVFEHKLPLPDKPEEGAQFLWVFLLDSGILKQPRVDFPFSLSKDNNKMTARLNELEREIQNDEELSSILKRYHADESTRPKTEDITATIKKSIGQLKTAETVTVGYQELSDYFKSGVFPAELQDFRDQLFHHVLVIGEFSWWNYYGPYIVALLGVICITAGVLLGIFTLGIGSYFSSVLISEGVGDITYAMHSLWSGNFSWSDYGTFKAISLAISLTTAGIGAYLGRGVQMAATAGLVGFKLFTAVGIQVAKHVAKTAFFTAVDIFISEALNKVREQIIAMASSLIKENVPKVAETRFAQLETSMNSVYENSYEKGQPTKLIKESVASTLSTAKAGVIGSAIYSKCAQLASNLSGTLGCATSKLTCNQTANKFMKIIKWINIVVTTGRILKAILDMVAYTGRIMDKMVEKLKSISGDLGNSRGKATKVEKMEKADFEKLKQTTKDQVSMDIANYMSSQITTNMLQPLIQQKVHQMLRAAGKAVANRTKTLFNSFRENTEQLANNEELDRQPLISEDEGVVNKNTIDGDARVKVLGPNNEVIGEISAKEAKAMYGDSAQLYRNGNGEVVLSRPSTETFINEIGNGKTTSELEVKACAEHLGVKIVIHDNVGILKTDGEGKATYNGGDKAVYNLSLTEDADGKQHITAIVDGVEIDIPEGKNLCFYQAVQYLRNLESGNESHNIDTSSLIKGVQDYARNNTGFKEAYQSAQELQTGLTAGASGQTPEMMGKDFMNRHRITRQEYESLFDANGDIDLGKVEQLVQQRKTLEPQYRPNMRRPGDELDVRKKNTFIIAEDDNLRNATQDYMNTNNPMGPGQPTVNRASTTQSFEAITIVRSSVVGPAGNNTTPITAIEYFKPRPILTGVTYDQGSSTWEPYHLFGPIDGFDTAGNPIKPPSDSFLYK